MCTVKRKTLAIPVRVVNWSDSSQVLSLFTRELGIVEAIAKGAHRNRNAFQGPFDLGMIWEVVFAERPPERGLSILTEGAVFEDFRGIRTSLRRWAAASFLLEYLRAVGTSGESARDLFDSVQMALTALATPELVFGEPEGDERLSGEDQVSLALLLFEPRALRVLGLSAPISACAECGRQWPGTDRPVFFSAEAGGILCTSCREGNPHRKGILVPGSAVRTYEVLSSTPPPHPGARPSKAFMKLDLRLVPPLEMVLKDLRFFLLEHDFKMIKYGPNFFKSISGNDLSGGPVMERRS